MNCKEYDSTATDTGTIPNDGPGQQLATGVPHGSFGFQFELSQATAVDGATGETFNPAENAVERIQDLLETALQGTDDDLAELIGRTHPRVVRKVAELLRMLRNNKAQVTIRMEGRYVALRTPGEVEEAGRRLARRNIEEETTGHAGTLTNIDPARRLFELRLSANDELIQGRIGQEVKDPHRIAARYSNMAVTATVRRVRVGESQPKYTLLGILE